MRIQVDFYVNKDIRFYNPLNEAMTAFIYRCIGIGNANYSKQLHEGFKRLGYKKFVYHSYNISQNKKTIQFNLKKGITTLILTSALEDTIVNFAKGLVKIGSVQLFGYSFNIKEIKLMSEPEFSNSEIFNAISPVYATDVNDNWLNIKETEEKLKENLIEKYYALYDRLPNNTNIKIRILSNQTEYIRYKKDTFRGYTGLVAIEGDKELIKLAYEGGLGARCGQGMGLLQVLN